MRALSKQEAGTIVEITSSIFKQGNAWVMEDRDLQTGTVRRTRCANEQAAVMRLQIWRKGKMEELLRANGATPAYALKRWHENPSWKGEGIWEWAQTRWYATREEAEQALEKKIQAGKKYTVIETQTAEIPGHFTLG